MVSDLQDHYAEYGVPEALWPGLIDTYFQGGTYDSQTGAPPVSSTPYVDDGMLGTIERWSDGSFEVRVMERASRGPRSSQTAGNQEIQSITGCRYYTSAGASSASGCLVQTTNQVITMSFVANYWQSARASAITWAGNYNATVIGGSWSFEHLQIQRARGYANSTTSAAYAEFAMMANFPFLGNSRAVIGLWVGPTRAWVVDTY